jgi:hypothetical protein
MSLNLPQSSDVNRPNVSKLLDNEMFLSFFFVLILEEKLQGFLI